MKRTLLVLLTGMVLTLGQATVGSADDFSDAGLRADVVAAAVEAATGEKASAVTLERADGQPGATATLAPSGRAHDRPHQPPLWEGHLGTGRSEREVRWQVEPAE